MKRYLLAIPLLLASSAIQAQSLSLLTGLHPRPQASYFLSPNRPTTISKDFIHPWIIAYDVGASKGTLRAIGYLQRTLKSLIGDTLLLYPITRDTNEPVVLPGINQIIIGEKDFVPGIQTMPGVDSLKRPESYLLSIDGNQMLIVGSDTNGTFNAVSTLAQLVQNSNDTIPSLHIYDYPDYPIRWVFSTHNMMVLSQVAAVEAIEDSMAAHKLNGLQQNDFKYSILDRFDSYYYSHVDSMRVHAEQNNIEVIPGVCTIGWSQAELIHDPDMAEGFPTTCRYVIEGDTGQLVGDPRVAVPNGNFENATGNTFPGWGWVDTTVHVDNTVVHSGRYSARAENFGNSAPNGRFIKLLTCSPHHGYHMSAWVKTQNFQGEFNLLAIGFHGASSRTLTYTQFGIPSTSDWQQANVIFNTLDYDSMYIYCGVWSGSAGTIWMDDYQIEDAGMTNLLHRADELPVVTGAAGRYTEGKDYAPIIDSIMENSSGSYTWHTPPTLHIPTGSKIHNGDSVSVSFIRANPVLNDVTGDGSTMVCVSEDTLYSIMHDQVHRVDSLLHRPNRYMISHDEIRQMNWDSACNRRQLTPAQLLADNVAKCDSIVTHVHPGADIFDWSDMFDSLHNAHNNYYLVNGDLTGDWNLIPKNITIINWNGGNMSKSLDFFAKHGFSQVTSPYYDVPNTNNIRAWRLAMDTIPNMRGSMYTTWANDYSFLTPFADYAWSAGPMIVHRPYPYDTTWSIQADVYPDPYDPTDSIVSVTLSGSNCWDYLWIDTLQFSGNHHYQEPQSGIPCKYRIVAVNKQGITRFTPWYGTGQVEGVSKPGLSEAHIALFPDPASNYLTLALDHQFIPRSIQIVNALGFFVQTSELRKQGDQLTIDTHALPNGAYELLLKSGAETITKPFVIVR